MDRGDYPGVRVQRHGVSEIIRGIFGLKETTFLEEVKRCVIPTVEVRALRYWEEFDEGIIRFNMVAFQAAVAAQFSGVEIALAGHPSGTVYAIDLIENLSAQTVELRAGSPSGFGVGAADAFYADNRWGGTALQAPISGIEGSAAVLGGAVFGRIQTAKSRERAYIGRQLSDGGETFGIAGATLNTAISVDIQGRIIFPR